MDEDNTTLTEFFLFYALDVVTDSLLLGGLGLEGLSHGPDAHMH